MVRDEKSKQYLSKLNEYRKYFYKDRRLIDKITNHHAGFHFLAERIELIEEKILTNKPWDFIDKTMKSFKTLKELIPVYKRVDDVYNEYNMIAKFFKENKSLISNKMFEFIGYDYCVNILDSIYDEIQKAIKIFNEKRTNTKYSDIEKLDRKIRNLRYNLIPQYNHALELKEKYEKKLIKLPSDNVKIKKKSIKNKKQSGALNKIPNINEKIGIIAKINNHTNYFLVNKKANPKKILQYNDDGEWITTLTSNKKIKTKKDIVKYFNRYDNFKYIKNIIIN